MHYTYDVFDRLIGKQVDDDGNETVDRGQFFVYDGASIILVYDETGSLTHRYFNGPDIDQPFADEQPSGTTWFLPDAQGTVRDVAEYDDGTGDTTVVNHIQYDAFGNITDPTED